MKKKAVKGESGQLRLGIPKGSLEESTYNLFRKAGFKITRSERSLYPSVDDSELAVMLFRPQEMPRYVEEGVIDAGVTGYDWIVENDSKVVEVRDLTYAKQTTQPVRWVLACHESSKFKSVYDLEGKRIATELVNVTRDYLRKKRVRAEVEFSWGATEAKPPRLADAIVEATETGSSLRANNLRIIDTVLTSTPKLIANRASYQDRWKREKIDNLALLLGGAMVAEQKVGLKMNVPERCLKAVLKKLPALKKPTIAPLSEKGWYDVETVIDEKIVRTLIPELKRAGASGIIEYPLNKVID